MTAALVATILVPAAGAPAARLLGRRAGLTGVAVAALALVPVGALLLAAADGETRSLTLEWLPAADLELGLRLDGLTAVMAALVALAALAVLIHARGYFVEAERAPSAIAGLLAFVAAMQGLVLASNLLTLLLFWELVGAASARLIAYERDKPKAAGGAIRAFLTTRSADLGLYAALAALWAGSGSLSFEAVRPEGAFGALVGVGLVLAAAGKSAQLPLQSWLSGAMAGPTPVSALLHSATMVAAGVYLLVRSQELLAGWPLELAGWLGAITALVVAAFALAQPDLKLVLASSTSSQLGLMFVAAGAAVPGAAMFQLIAHAAGKAGMFLAAGAFQRRRGATDLAELAGVGREDRRAFLGFAIGAASIAAVPPLAVFWSKDAVLKAAEAQPAWFAMAVLASAGTAAYLLRPALVLWRGEPGKRPDPPGHAWMLAGVFLLAAGSLTLGAIHTPLAEILGFEVPAPSVVTVAASLVALAAGIAIIAAGLSAGPRARALAREQLGTNRAIERLVLAPALALARGADRADRAIDAVVDGVGRGARALAGGVRTGDGLIDAGVDELGVATVAVGEGSAWAERSGVDAGVDGLAKLVERGGGQLPRLQGGQLYIYLRNTVAGIAFLLAIFALTAIT